MGIFDRLFKNNQKGNNPEIEKINREVAQMPEDLVIQMVNILPPELKLDYSVSSVKLIDALIEKLRSEGNDEKRAENDKNRQNSTCVNKRRAVWKANPFGYLYHWSRSTA